MGRLVREDITEMIKLIKATYPYALKDIEGKEDIAKVKDLWFLLLGEYPKELVIKAFHECLKVEKVNIVPASIIEQIEKIQSAFEPSEQELWQELRSKLNKVADLNSRRKYTALEANGLTQGQNAMYEIERLYNGFSGCIKRYCGSVSGLIQLAELDDEQMEFEKARFLKGIRKKQDEIKIQQQCPQLAELSNKLFLEKR